MPLTRNPYPPKFREQLVTIAHSGHCLDDLAREFEPCAATIMAGSSKPTGMATVAMTVWPVRSAKSFAAYAGRLANFDRREIAWQRLRL